MDINGIDRYSQNMPSYEQTEVDTYEQDIQKQLTDLRGKMRSISNDKEKSEEEKSDEKKDVQKQIQDLNAELRKHQVEKRMEEAQKKREEKREEKVSETMEQNKGMDKEEAAVLFESSGAKKQLESMSKVRTDLEGQLTAAETEEERRAMLERIHIIFKSMGDKIRDVNGTISDLQTGNIGKPEQKSQAELQEELARNMGKGSVVYSSEDGIVIRLAAAN